MALPLVASLVSLGSRLVTPRLIPYISRFAVLGLSSLGLYHSYEKIKTNSVASPVPVSSDVDNSDSSLNPDLLSDYSDTVKSISDFSPSVDSVDSVDVPDVSVPKVSPEVQGNNLIDVLSSSNANLVDVLNNVVQSIYDLQKVITASSIAVVNALDSGFSSVAISNISTSVPQVFNPSNVINNSVNVDTSPIATTLKPSVDSISSQLEAQKRYYDKVLSPSDISDLDGNIVVSGVDSVDIDKIKNAVLSRSMTDLNNFSADDLDDDIDIDDLLGNIDLSQLFKLIRLSEQLKNNGGVV